MGDADAEGAPERRAQSAERGGCWDRDCTHGTWDRGQGQGGEESGEGSGAAARTPSATDPASATARPQQAAGRGRHMAHTPPKRGARSAASCEVGRDCALRTGLELLELDNLDTELSNSDQARQPTWDPPTRPVNTGHEQHWRRGRGRGRLGLAAATTTQPRLSPVSRAARSCGMRVAYLHLTSYFLLATCPPPKKTKKTKSRKQEKGTPELFCILRGASKSSTYSMPNGSSQLAEAATHAPAHSLRATTSAWLADGSRTPHT
jgi:hypothetical protein